MTDKKLSQLPVGTAVQDADLFYCAQSLGGGLYTQVQQPMSAVGTYLLAASTATADPTATVSLTVVNGVATTAMRSDAAPALSQTIVPTWSGLHTFNGGIAGTGGLWSGLHTFNAGIAGAGGFAVDTSGNVTAKNIFGAAKQRSVTNADITAGAFSVTSADQILNCNISSVSPSCTLPLASSRAGVALTFKDVGNQFSAHPLTLSCSGGELIDGMSSYVLRDNYSGVRLVPLNDDVNSGWFIG